jgi:hypothetical protein
MKKSEYLKEKYKDKKKEYKPDKVKKSIRGEKVKANYTQGGKNHDAEPTKPRKDYKIDR